MHHSNPIQEPPRRWYTTAEVADALGVDPSTVSSGAKAGRIPAIQPWGPHGCWLIDPDYVDALLRGESR